MSVPEPVTFKAADGWALAGDLYGAPSAKIGIIISAGTGFPRRFYRHLAGHLASKGAMVLTYDYRGIGDLAPQDLARSTIDMPDWGRLDLSAAITVMDQRMDDRPLGHIAHSVGGHFLGIVPNHNRIHRHAFVSVGTGYFPRHHLTYAPLELYFWWGLGSYSLWRHGYIRKGGGWNGEPLPPQVFKSWRRWCHRPNYFGDDIPTRLSPAHYDQVTAPIRSWIFSDDPIATPATAQDLLSLYPSAPNSLHLSRPADLGQKRIGHEGAFRPGLEPLWDQILSWLSGDSAGQSGQKVPEPAIAPKPL